MDFTETEVVEVPFLWYNKCAYSERNDKNTEYLFLMKIFPFFLTWLFFFSLMITDRIGLQLVINISWVYIAQEKSKLP